MTEKKNISSHYYNVGQLRIDQWNSLKSETTKLAHSNRNSEAEQSHSEQVLLLLDESSTVESYFAFPGMAKMNGLKEMLERKEHTALSRQIAEITRLLVSDRYRSNSDFLEDDETGVELTQYRTEFCF